MKKKNVIALILAALLAFPVPAFAFAEEAMPQDAAATEETVAADVDGWDSLVHISIIFDIETKFGIKFSMSEVQNFKNVGEIVDAIEKRTL